MADQKGKPGRESTAVFTHDSITKKIEGLKWRFGKSDTEVKKLLVKWETRQNDKLFDRIWSTFDLMKERYLEMDLEYEKLYIMLDRESKESKDL